MSKTITEIIIARLKANNYDGLYRKTAYCWCFVDQIENKGFPCRPGYIGNCRAGVLQNCTDGRIKGLCRICNLEVERENAFHIGEEE